MHFVTEVTYKSDYQLKIRFEDGSVRMVDLEPYLDGEVFEPLKDKRLFQTAHLEPDLDTVVWEGGADMSPDFLYEIGVPILRVAESSPKYGLDNLK